MLDYLSMPELLLEVGTEELPASFVRKAYEDLLASIQSMLQAEGLEGSGKTLGTPRRLIISITGLPDRQPDSVKEMRGPALKSAFDADGNPTPALKGFCRGQGVDVESIRRDEQYVWVTKHIEGRLTRDVLAELLPKAIRGLSFEKSMRWGAYRQRFARPIRWMLAVFDGQLVSYDIEGVVAGIESQGHRFYAPEKFVAVTFDQLMEELRARKVEPDPEIRSQRIIEQAKAVAGGEPDLPEALVEENTFLTEWPTAIVGSFPESLLELPEPVLVTAMAKHEKMFPVRDADGALLNRFVFTRNNGEDETVRKGCEWVLNARFNDARFFYEEDKKSTLDDFLEKTQGIVFQAELGTVRQRADRLAALTAALAAQAGLDSERGRLAGLYSKADLATGLVSELSSLQGVIGGVYASREGLPSVVADAIRDQYDAAVAVQAPLSACLSAADALDKLAGYLGIGLAPSGSSDPYGLRRAATTLIEISWARPEFGDWEGLFDLALSLYSGVELDGAKAKGLLSELFESRYGALLGMVRYDLLAAALRDPLSPRGVLFRSRALEVAAGDEALVQTATRPINLVSSAEKKGIAVGEPESDSELAAALLASLSDAATGAELAVKNEEPQALVDALRATVAPINAYLDATMIMVEDEAVRAARLGLLSRARSLFLLAGDFTKIVG
jgi:glycyl-tRNA synthetase beta chain